MAVAGERLVADGLGQRLQPGDAVFDAALALLVGTKELDAVVESHAAHLESGLALPLPPALPLAA